MTTAAVSSGGSASNRANTYTASGWRTSLRNAIAPLVSHVAFAPKPASPMPNATSESGTAAVLICASVWSRNPGSARPENPNAVPARMLATTGLRTTPSTVLPSAAGENLPSRAHSTETVASVHNKSELNTSTSETAGSAASLSVTFASGTPSRTLFEKMPDNPKSDCAAPSIRNSTNAATPPTP